MDESNHRGSSDGLNGRYELAPEYKQELVRALRRQPTPAEARLWELLRGRKVGGLKFRRSTPSAVMSPTSAARRRA